MRQSARFISRASGFENHHIALVLGSGWSGAADLLGEKRFQIPARKVPGFKQSQIPGHTGQIASIRLANGKNVLVLGSRTHLYENRGVQAVVHGVRVAAACGATKIILTNGGGGMDPKLKPGTPVLISDHINLTATSPLEGATFIDLTDLYSKRLRTIAHSVNPSLEEGVYVQFRGPNYETPAEVQMAKAMGGDIVGMSTALEAIAAREAGIEVLGISLITNLAAGISPHPLSHQEVIDAGRAAEPIISTMLAKIVLAL